MDLIEPILKLYYFHNINIKIFKIRLTIKNHGAKIKLFFFFILIIFCVENTSKS